MARTFAGTNGMRPGESHNKVEEEHETEHWLARNEQKSRVEIAERKIKAILKRLL